MGEGSNKCRQRERGRERWHAKWVKRWNSLLFLFFYASPITANNKNQICVIEPCLNAIQHGNSAEIDHKKIRKKCCKSTRNVCRMTATCNRAKSFNCNWISVNVPATRYISLPVSPRSRSFTVSSYGYISRSISGQLLCIIIMQQQQ